jgi:hypothetical protein
MIRIDFSDSEEFENRFSFDSGEEKCCSLSTRLILIIVIVVVCLLCLITLIIAIYSLVLSSRATNTNTLPISVSSVTTVANTMTRMYPRSCHSMNIFLDREKEKQTNDEKQIWSDPVDDLNVMNTLFPMSFLS